MDHLLCRLVDSTGIKVANRGEWMRDKWNRRRGFLKIHVGVDVNSKKIRALKITDERSHDAQHLPSQVYIKPNDNSSEIV
jgi:hypothetical protein